MALITLTVFVLHSEKARARTPNFTVQFNLRETPGDPSSHVTHRVIAGLLENTRNGDRIGWEAAILTIHELDFSGNVIFRWSTGYPTVGTPDGLWWIQHADSDNPVTAEFMVPPRIYDTALALDLGAPDLDFDIEGQVYIEPPGGAPFETTGSLDSFLAPICIPDLCGCPPHPLCDPPPPPKKDEKDEPVEAPNDPAEPFPF